MPCWLAAMLLPIDVELAFRLVRKTSSLLQAKRLARKERAEEMVVEEAPRLHLLSLNGDPICLAMNMFNFPTRIFRHLGSLVCVLFCTLTKRLGVRSATAQFQTAGVTHES